MKQPDKLFREKLLGYSEPAPAQAWQKIEKQLPAKKINWLAIAAALIPLFLLGAYLLQQPNELVENRIAVNDNTSTNDKPAKVKAEKPKDVKKENVETQKENLATEKFPAEKKQKINNQQKTKIESVEKKKNPPLNFTNITKESLIVKAEEKFINTENTEIFTSTLPAEKAEAIAETTTLVYTASEVNEKYVLKNKDTEATVTTEDASSIQKLLQKAGELTTNQSPIANLRSKKNEILALNFRNEKSERNK
ncbi:MAG: hypothetical protein MUF68_04445 [Cyclobacteriaceae bacterium]|jgi:hypothetical protein|nr:hypothetical protein [Cyclobacteriaceae bacterium]